MNMPPFRRDTRGISRLLKNTHLLCFPHPSSLRRTLTVRLGPTHQLVGVARCRSLFVATPLSGLREPCIWAFLISLKKRVFQPGPQTIDCRLRALSKKLARENWKTKKGNNPDVMKIAPCIPVDGEVLLLNLFSSGKMIRK